MPGSPDAPDELACQDFRLSGISIASPELTASTPAVGQNHLLCSGTAKRAAVAIAATTSNREIVTDEAVGGAGAGGVSSDMSDQTSSVAGFSRSSRTVARYCAAIAPSTIR